MSGYPEFSLVARRRLLPAGGTRLERGEGRGGRWGCSGSRRDKKVVEEEEEEEGQEGVRLPHCSLISSLPTLFHLWFLHFINLFPVNYPTGFVY